MTLEKEIFPAATDSRFIRAVSIGRVHSKENKEVSYVNVLPFTMTCWIFMFMILGGYPCNRLFPNEPDTNPAARSQRVSE